MDWNNTKKTDRCCTKVIDSFDRNSTIEYKYTSIEMGFVQHLPEASDLFLVSHPLLILQTDDNLSLQGEITHTWT